MNNKEVFILGSGFSKAIHNLMPTLDELGQEIESKLISENNPYNLGLYNDYIKKNKITNFEEALTLMYQNFPWQEQGERQLLSYLYTVFSNKIVEILIEKQEQFDFSKNESFKKIIDYFHYSKAQIISFNYDTLLEDITLNYHSGGVNLEDFYRMPFMKLANRFVSLWGGKFHETFRLLKLHGSINWYRADIEYKGDSQIYLEIKKEELLEKMAKKDLIPFIIPPVFDKSSFMNMNTVNTIWRESLDFIKSANKIYIIGYSIPQSDLAVNLMLRTSVSEKTIIIPVNLDKGVIDRLNALFKNKDIKIIEKYAEHKQDIVLDFIIDKSEERI